MAAFSTLAAGLFLSRAVALRVTAQIEANLAQEARLARDLLLAEADLPGVADASADRLGHDLGVRVTIIDAAGKVLGDTDLDGEALAMVESHAGRPEVRAALRAGQGRAIRYSSTVAENMLYVAARVDPADPAGGVVRLAVPLTEVRRSQEEVRAPIFIAGALSVAVAALLGWLAARGPSRRLQGMAKAASDVAAGRPGARAPAWGSDEIAALARSLNRMAGQLEERLATLERERSQLRTVLDGMVEGVVLTDAAGRILVANGAFARMFGVQPPVEGRRPLEVVRLPALQEAIEAALGADAPLSRAIVTGGERERVVQASLAAVRDGESVAGAVAVFHDVTDLQKLERARRDFVANVSHELRTPLTAIKGYAETLRDLGLTDPSAKEFVDVIHRHAERLRALIEDLLDLAAIEQGRARIAPAPVPVRDAAAQAEAAVRPAAAAKSHAVSLDIPAGLPPAFADRDRLAQVLINLLDNAIKFTPAGGRIAVTARREGPHLVIAVSDNGPGIPAGEIDRVFERFYRVSRSRERGEGGTGLGLAICKHLVQAMGGAIEVESREGQGTTFRVTLPLGPPVPDGGPAAPDTGPAAPRAT